MVSLATTVPWLIDRNGDDAREATERNALEDQRRDCVRAAESGTELRATAIAGVEHAEATAHLMRSIRDVLQQGSPQSPTVVAISEEIDRYVDSVSSFRVTAERYQPRQLSECRMIGADILDPLPGG